MGQFLCSLEETNDATGGSAAVVYHVNPIKMRASDLIFEAFWPGVADNSSRDSTTKEEIFNQFFPTSSEAVQTAPDSGQFDISSFSLI